MDKINKEYIDKIIQEDINSSNFLKKVNKDLYLRENEINLLEKYNIDYRNFNNISELIYFIEFRLNQESIEELELLSYELSERNYYQNTNK